jgi:glycosyltransferase involved in cell wall biosynthesis
MSHILFSILIPVYNVEKYIKECLESVINQSYQNFEAIIMVDGSQDKSASICEEYALKDKRFKVFYQDNVGLLQTRRNLIKIAKGDFILFIDSDDFYEPNMIDIIHQTIINQSCDLVLFRLNRMTDTGRIYASDKGAFTDNSIFTSESKALIWEKVISTNSLNHMCTKAVKRDLIDDKDYEGYNIVYGEDVLLSLPLLNRAKRICYRDKALYNYRMSANGLGRNFQLRNIDDTQFVRNIVLKFLINSKLDTDKNRVLFFTSYSKSFIRLIRLMIANFGLNSLIVKKLNELMNSDLFIVSKQYSTLNSLSLLEKVYYHLFINHHFRLLKMMIDIDFNITMSLKRIIRR